MYGMLKYYTEVIDVIKRILSVVSILTLLTAGSVLLLTACGDKTDYKEQYRQEGINKLDRGDYKGAINSFITALSQGHGFVKTTDYDINYYLGYAYYQIGDYKSSIETYDAILDLKPKETNGYYYRALAKLKTGDLAGAQEDFQTVTSSDSKNYDLCIDVYFCMIDAGYERQATEYLQEVLDNAKGMNDYDKGRMCYYLGNYSDARVYLEKAKDMSDPDTILMLGKTYEAISDFSYAASLYNTYLAERGNSAAVYNQLGVCRMKMEDFQAALSAFESGINLCNEDWEQELLYNEAITYEYIYDFATAYEKMGKYLEKYPKDEAAQREYVFLSTRQ